MVNYGIVKNPLSVIAIFAGVAEISGSGVLPFISPENQHLYIWFLMSFPFVLILLFFATLNWNHKALYAPSDYKSDESFLESLSRSNSRRTEIASMEKIIESKVEEGLSSAEGVQDLTGKSAIAKRITASIKNSAFLTIDASPLTGNKKSVFDLPYVAFASLGQLTNEIYFLIEDYVNPFEYGHSWVLRRSNNSEVIKNARMITGAKIGTSCPDNRSLKEVGIMPGMTIQITRP
ncbi:hypothetical protein ACO0K7_16190 [Undibacterium sp. Ji67W]|uniref:hypothetical protein n=1 Tax=Undibacterium sp. Ji67W TaxID=3413042 RepID=UPI003BF10949